MSKKNKNFARLTLLCVFLIFLWLISYIFNPYKSWKEEVKLSDGRTIVVEQKKRMEKQIAREAWLTINLPEFSSKPMVWHENLDPLVLNISNGNLYIVGRPPTGLEMRQYGISNPFYICFEWKNGKFERIPFEQIPEAIYDANMLIDSYPPDGVKALTLAYKNTSILNKRPTTPNFYKRLDPKAGTFY